MAFFSAVFLYRGGPGAVETTELFCFHRSTQPTGPFDHRPWIGFVFPCLLLLLQAPPCGGQFSCRFDRKWDAGRCTAYTYQMIFVA